MNNTALRAEAQSANNTHGFCERGTRLAFNFYMDRTPSVDDYESRDEQVSE